MMKDKKILSTDILTCISNLSSDEVFTPPNIAKQILYKNILVYII